jgi:hypothetical protein
LRGLLSARIYVKQRLRAKTYGGDRKLAFAALSANKDYAAAL